MQNQAWYISIRELILKLYTNRQMAKACVHPEYNYGCYQKIYRQSNKQPGVSLLGNVAGYLITTCNSYLTFLSV
ncbi:hypothetical protein BDA96_07G147300 [Sorghum bicolor]|uniref:Uncharacterized protein n=1 Tax=Sorghum bicolor TaxID=4558 RepID=A0A921QLB4_SORBI|nr:hypothetical protein BDA96_07G147300 [Sorghum bicolor]